ncbi:hypothetical protein D4765_10345 [Subtercola vilae]|uniref:Uncharacterized protein n=1 Tax=Subtercola vilae TaxID=2056433 RepID=A0A4T2BX34_9MICO|nr:hypothetical protein D4765_10345 [Subtercola vilae]
MTRAGFDLPLGGAQPGVVRFVIATIVAVVLSLLACAAIAAASSTLWPSIAGYDHFRFADYGKLTIIGVVLACISWPLICLISSNARRPFLWLTVLVTVVGLAPDAWILYKGQPVFAVVALVIMHFALALITFPALVLIAPQRPKLKPSWEPNA